MSGVCEQDDPKTSRGRHHIPRHPDRAPNRSKARGFGTQAPSERQKPGVKGGELDEVSEFSSSCARWSMSASRRVSSVHLHAQCGSSIPAPSSGGPWSVHLASLFFPSSSKCTWRGEESHHRVRAGRKQRGSNSNVPAFWTQSVERRYNT